MVRFRRFAVALPIVAGLVFAWSVNAQPPADSAAPLPEIPVVGAPRKPAKVPGIPSFSLLGVEPVQAELKLTDEQKQKIRDLIADFDKQARAEMAAFQALPPQEQQVKVTQVQQASAKRMETLRTELEKVLTPQQLTELQQLAYQMTVAVNPQVLESAELTEAQRKDLDQIRNEAQAKMWEVQREVAKKTTKLLTPEQTKKVQSLIVQNPGN